MLYLLKDVKQITYMNITNILCYKCSKYAFLVSSSSLNTIYWKSDVALFIKYCCLVYNTRLNFPPTRLNVCALRVRFELCVPEPAFSLGGFCSPRVNSLNSALSFLILAPPPRLLHHIDWWGFNPIRIKPQNVRVLANQSGAQACVCGRGLAVSGKLLELYLGAGVCSWLWVVCVRGLAVSWSVLRATLQF